MVRGRYGDTEGVHISRYVTWRFEDGVAYCAWLLTVAVTFAIENIIHRLVVRVGKLMSEERYW